MVTQTGNRTVLNIIIKKGFLNDKHLTNNCSKTGAKGLGCSYIWKQTIKYNELYNNKIFIEDKISKYSLRLKSSNTKIYNVVYFTRASYPYVYNKNNIFYICMCYFSRYFLLWKRIIRRKNMKNTRLIVFSQWAKSTKNHCEGVYF